MRANSRTQPGWRAPTSSRIAAIVRAAAHHGRALGLGRPHWVAVTLLATFRCNLSCPYCDFPRHSRGELSTAEITTLLHGLGRAGALRLSISGGEPLLRDDLDQILVAASQQGFIVSLVTNGTLLEERQPHLAAVDYLLCAIEGNEGVHDRARGAGTFQKTVSGLEYARSCSDVRVGLICPVHSDNVLALEEPLELAEQMGARVFYQPVQERVGWCGPPLNGELSNFAVRAAFDRIRKWKAKGRPVGNSSRYLNLVASGERLRRHECTAGRYFVTVLPDGRVAPCCMFSFEADWPRINHEAPRATAAEVKRFECAGCTIAPYVESSYLLKPSFSSWLEILRWRPRVGGAADEGYGEGESSEATKQTARHGSRGSGSV